MHPLLCQQLFAEDTAGITAELCEARGWHIFQLEYPILDVGFRAPAGGTLRVRFHCEGWNETPPTIELLEWDGSYVTRFGERRSDIFNEGSHPNTGRPFVCMRGSREYHTHSSHLADQWDDLKGKSAYRLAEILTQVWRGWRRTQS